MPKLSTALLLSVCLLASSSVAMAQEGPTDPYLAGVGAYNAGNHEAAAEHLTLAIEESPQDPRAYYFRGLARLALDERVEGTDDLRQAATLELAAGWSYASIDRALATVQGSARTTVERVRREVRLAAERTERTEPARQRRAAWEAEEKKVLRTRTQLPIEALVNQLTPDQALAAANKNQGAAEEYVASTDEEAAPAVAASAPEVNPFADEPNPFDQDPAAEMPEAEPGPVVAAQPDDSPFTDDPFLQPGPPQPGANPPAGAAPGAGPNPEDLAKQFFFGLGQLFSGKAPPVPGGGFGPPAGGGGFGPPDGGGFGPPAGFPGAEGEMTPEDPDGAFGPPADDASPFDSAPEDASPFDSDEPAEPETEGESPFDAAEPPMEGDGEASPFDSP